MASQTLSRFLASLLLPLPLSLALAAAAQAGDVPYRLKAGETTGKIALPANIPVLIIGAQRSPDSDFGTGQVTILSVPRETLQWTGYDVNGLTAGASATTGTHIIFIDAASTVDLEVDGTNGIIIHNGSGDTVVGQITLMF